MIKEIIGDTTFEIIANSEVLLVAKVTKEDIAFAIQYNKSECKKEGIDSTDFINIFYPKDDRNYLMNIRNALNKWLIENHSDKFN